MKAEAETVEARASYFRTRANAHRKLATDFEMAAEECAARAMSIRTTMTEGTES